MARVRVLVADDEPSILRSTDLLLRSMGYEVATASHASAIVETARRMRPHILLQDVRMPGLDLDRLVADIRADPALASLDIVLFSASMDLTEVAARVGAKRIVEKPFTVDEIRAALGAAAV